MSETKHTPEPWVVENYDGHGEVLQIVGRGPVVSGTIATIHTVWAHETQRHEQVANAHLIVAAPELRIALKTAMSVLLLCTPQGKSAASLRLVAMKLGRAAIAKAENLE